MSDTGYPYTVEPVLEEEMHEAPMDIPVGDIDNPMVDPQTGHIMLPDGNILVPVGDGSGSPYDQQSDEIPFDANLAEYLSAEEQNRISSELIEGIEEDDESRSEWLETFRYGIKLLGLKVEQGSTDAGSSGLETMFKTTHPLLLEAVIRATAEAKSALLPSSGPVKIRDDRPPRSEPEQPQMMGHNGGPPLDEMPPMNGGGAPFEQPQMPGFAGGGYVNGNGYANGGHVFDGYADGGAPQPQGQQQPMGGGSPININVGQQGTQQQENQGQDQGGAANTGMPSAPPVPRADRDLLATAFEKDFNHYLTAIAKEYYPDTGRMLFWTNFGGKGVKKVYNCPLRRRPVSESVPVEDFIISNAMSDLSNASRITHQIKMRPSVLRRMQLMGAYRDIELQPATEDNSNPVEQGKADMAGVQPSGNSSSNPKDIDYRLYETLCELDLDQFAPEHFRGQGLPLPYRVTIEKESRKILALHRNWKENDKECQAKEYYVDFSYIEANGFYSIGLLGILGNLTRTLTTIQCEFVDAGLRANFPSFLYSKGMGRQNTNNFIVGPGQGVGLDTGLKDIREAAIPFPFKDLGPSFVAYAQHLEEYGKQLGGTANIQVGEGKQDAPVGTTLAMIEQATKSIGSVIKGYHHSQQKELQLLKERFREDPGAFRRFNKRPSADWQEAQFLKALDDYDLVPVSDPNNPTHMHRLAKAEILKQVALAVPGEFNARKTSKRVLSMCEIDDVDDLYNAEVGAQPNPEQTAAQAMLMDAQAKVQGEQFKQQFEPMKEAAKLQDREKERQSKAQIEAMRLKGKEVGLAATLAIHSDDQELKAAGMGLDAAKSYADHGLKRSQHTTKATLDHNKTQLDAALKHKKIVTDADVKRETAKKKAAQ